MEKKTENQVEEITEFPVQDTFNFDCMIIEEGERDTDGICNADKQAGSGK